jgi:hypothetical protein
MTAHHRHAAVPEGCMTQRLITRPRSCTSVEASQPGIASRSPRAAVRGCAPNTRRGNSVEMKGVGEGKPEKRPLSLHRGQMRSAVTQFANEDCSPPTLFQSGLSGVPRPSPTSDSCPGCISGRKRRHRDMDESTFPWPPANGTSPRSPALPHLCPSGLTRGHGQSNGRRQKQK